ncbi:hypothetical protein [Thiobacillus sedimenti]|uniref:Uncharacterized protein n=1 Tax=Thiobacillus sedimenti TaxID=3110231 RepID=A0ABZ1CHF2_9PROT|nr:hypothetical protein [Thiobacillus sp. SCUT-2]WRS38468.1 hypothetical protein VA613_10680 [Thiobacillus sp. SCUT-2]
MIIGASAPCGQRGILPQKKAQGAAGRRHRRTVAGSGQGNRRFFKGLRKTGRMLSPPGDADVRLDTGCKEVNLLITKSNSDMAQPVLYVGWHAMRMPDFQSSNSTQGAFP